jgi:cell division protein FtsW (lipid II flippase)
MMLLAEILARPRLGAILCGATATSLGLAWMAAAEAPARFLAVNAAAFAIGLMLLPALDSLLGGRSRLRGIALLAMAGIVCATAFIGTPVEGAARWLSIGSLVIQPGMMVLPLLICAQAQRPDRASTGALLLTLAATALQPDRALAGMALAGIAAIALAKPRPTTLWLLGAAGGAFAVTVIRPDRQGAMPYVDQILSTAFDVHPLAGAAVWVGSAILLLPACAAFRAGTETRAIACAFAAVWAAAVLAALLGNYPTPLVGYSGSAVLGYVLSLSQFPPRGASRMSDESQAESRAGADDTTMLPVTALA